MTIATLRKLALALPGTEEQDHHGRPSFRIEGKIFATLPDKEHVNVMVDEDLVDMALATAPDQHAGWMIVEEQSEGGDVLARRVREDAAFASGMTRVCAGGGVALYRRE